jgi:hypothetical protein
MSTVIELLGGRSAQDRYRPYDSAGLPARTNTDQNPSATGWLSTISTLVNPALSSWAR